MYAKKIMSRTLRIHKIQRKQKKTYRTSAVDSHRRFSQGTKACRPSSCHKNQKGPWALHGLVRTGIRH